MSPWSSLTTNVFPSRMLTNSLTAGPLRRYPEQTLDKHEHLRVAVDHQLAAQHGGDPVGPAVGEVLEQRPRAADHAVRSDALLGHPDIPALGPDRPLVGPLAVA